MSIYSLLNEHDRHKYEMIFKGLQRRYEREVDEILSTKSSTQEVIQLIDQTYEQLKETADIIAIEMFRDDTEDDVLHYTSLVFDTIMGI